MAAGRPRSFDVEAAEEAALQLFWDRGYEGVSLINLRETLGISSASFYAAFGSKEGLFVRAVDRYVTQTNHVMRTIADESLDPHVALTQFLHESVDAQTRTDNPKGCLLALNGTLAGPAVPERAQAAIKSRRAEDRRQIRAFLDRTVQRCSEDPQPDLEGWTVTLHGFVLGVAVQARDGISPRELHQAADVLAQGWTVAFLSPSESASQSRTVN